MAGKGFRVNWRGKDVARRVTNASRIGIDITMALCVPDAKRNTPVVTGTAQGSIMFKPAQIRGFRVTGVWGSFDVNYFIWLEIGARGRAGHPKPSNLRRFEPY